MSPVHARSSQSRTAKGVFPSIDSLGAGKTMLALAFGHPRWTPANRVFTSGADLVARTAGTATEGRWQATMRFARVWC